MKKILGLTIALVAVIAMLGTGTWAYFSSAVTVAGNTVTAGTLTLSNSTLVPFDIGTLNSSSIGGLEPGDKGNAAAWTLQNTGSLPGVAAIAFPSAVTSEVKGTDNTTSLTSAMKMAVWINVSGDGTWGASDYYLTSAGGWSREGTGTNTYGGTAPDAAYLPVAAFMTTPTDSSAASRTTKYLTVLPKTTSTGKIVIDYYWPDSTPANDNILQGTSFKFDLTVSLLQATTNSLTITTAPVLTAGTHSVLYSPVTLAAAGNTGTVSWSLATGSTLPSGLTLNGTTGVINGTPGAATAGTTTFIIVATDGATQQTASQNFLLTINQ